MSTPLRFPIWLLSTLPVMFAVGALGYLLPASGIASPRLSVRGYESGVRRMAIPASLVVTDEDARVKGKPRGLRVAALAETERRCYGDLDIVD